MNMKALTIENLEKRYSGGVQALSGISLSVEAGDFFALLGPNGAGKSTTIGIISTLVQKTAGQVKVFGHDLDTEPLALKKMLGLVPQEFNFNIFEKVEDIIVNQAGYYGVPYKRAKQNAGYYLKKLDLWEKRHETAGRLSGGMKRRLMIARGMVHEPKLLILDEPTAGVDVEMRQSTWTFLKELNANGVTIMLTTHYLEEAEALCRNVAIIDEGQIKLTGDIQALLAAQAQEYLIELAEPFHGTLSVENVEISSTEALNILRAKMATNIQLNEILLALVNSGAKILGVRPASNRLEKLFLDMVREKATS